MLPKQHIIGWIIRPNGVQIDYTWFPKSGQRLDRDKSFVRLLCLGADVAVATLLPPSLPVLFADWFHTSVSHEAHHRCLSPLARLSHRRAVCPATEALDCTFGPAPSALAPPLPSSWLGEAVVLILCAALTSFPRTPNRSISVLTCWSQISAIRKPLTGLLYPYQSHLISP